MKKKRLLFACLGVFFVLTVVVGVLAFVMSNKHSQQTSNKTCVVKQPPIIWGISRKNHDIPESVKVPKDTVLVIEYVYLESHQEGNVLEFPLNAPQNGGEIRIPTLGVDLIVDRIVIVKLEYKEQAMRFLAWQDDPKGYCNTF